LLFLSSVCDYFFFFGKSIPDICNALSKRERFYKLSSQGLLTFIKQHPSPYEFLVAMIWYGFLNFKSAFKRDEFNRYYDLYIRGYIGESNLRSCFFLGNLFENLFRGWRKELEHKCEIVIPEGLFSRMQHMFEHDVDFFFGSSKK